MSTIVRSIRISLLTPLIALAMIGAISGCNSPVDNTGPTNSVSKGSDAAIRTSLKTDARSLQISLDRFMFDTGKYPPLEESGGLVGLLNITLNKGNYLLSYSPAADRQSYQITLTNDLLFGDKTVTFDSEISGFH